MNIRDLTVRFGERSAGDLLVFDRFSLELAKGTFVSLIGPSGCGKTTLLHTVSGLLQPDSGDVDVKGESVALVFQRPHLIPWRTALDNAIYGLECRGRRRQDARPAAARLLERMGLSGHLDDSPHQLSEGMKQRVNLARALLVEPDLLLLDEPFSALDSLTRRRLQDQLLDLWRERNLTVLFVSHSIEEVVYLSDRVVLLSDKPATILGDVAIDLPRPRALDAEAKLALLKTVDELERLLVPSDDD